MLTIYRLCVIVLMLSLFTVVNAQIVIDESEYQIEFNSELTMYSYSDSFGVGVAVDVGTTGGPQTWTFSVDQFPGGDSQTYTVLQPSATPFSAEFPQADHAWFSEDTEDTTSIYQYFNKKNDGLYLEGFALTFEDSQMVTPNNPPEKLIPFPASLGKTWTNTNVTEFGQPGFFSFIDSTHTDLEIDAWGTVTIDGDNYDCLRVFHQVEQTSKVVVMGVVTSSETTTNLEYLWFAEDIGFVASVSSMDGETNPNFSTAMDVTFRQGGANSIEQFGNQAELNYRLEQNYPNPFNPVTTIGFNLKEQTELSLKVFDVRGSEVETIMSGVKNAGYHTIRYDASNLSAGLYLYELRSANFVERRKMMLLK